MKNLKQLLGLCEHKWTIINKAAVYSGDETEGVLPTSIDYVLQCEKCGAVKNKRT